MKKILAICFAAAFVSSAYAATEKDAARIVKKYSETVACQLEDISSYQKNQYKAVKLVAGDTDMGGLGDIFVVYWEGDVGCAGGNGTIVPNFTVVEQAGFSSVAPVVKSDYKFPDINMVRLTSMTVKNGLLLIKGVTYGPKDNQGQPNQSVTYTLKLNGQEFIKQ